MSGGIFISYRRDDAKHAAGRLVDRLEHTFSREQLFLDIDNIAPGLDFVKVLSQQVEACDVLLAVIGPGWLDSRDKNGTRRLDNPKDFVRIEIEAALARDIRVIPVLVDGAQMPGEQELPPSLHPLLVRNAVRLVHERFGSDAEDLTRALAKVVVPKKGGWFGGGYVPGRSPGRSSKPAAHSRQPETQLKPSDRNTHQTLVDSSRADPTVSDRGAIAQALLFLAFVTLGFLVLVNTVSQTQLGAKLIVGYLLLVIGAGAALRSSRGAAASLAAKRTYLATALLAGVFLVPMSGLALGFLR